MTVTELAAYGLPEDATAGLDVDNMNAHLRGASRKADSYLANRGYALPLTAYGDDLKQVVGQIAAWTILVSLRGVNPNDPGHAAIRMNHDDSIKWLLDVSEGRANLDVQTTTPARKRTGTARVFSTNTRRE